MAIVNGTPAIAYYNDEERNLMFARNSAADSYGTWTVSTVDDSGYVSDSMSLATVDGHPAIGYYGGSDFDLKFVRAADAAGATWGAPVSVDTTGSVGSHVSLAIVDGHPAMSYYDATNQDLKFVRALDAAGATWGTPLSVDTTGNVGQYTSLAVVNGCPAISYFDATNGDLKFVRALDASGTTWGIPVSVVTEGYVGGYASLAIVDGHPAMSYATNGTPKFVRASDASGTAWETPVSIDTSGLVGTYTSLAIIDGYPAITYVGSAFVEIVRANDASGTTWGTPLEVIYSAQPGSLVVVDGHPSISYYDLTTRSMMFVRADDPSGTAWGNFVRVDAGVESGNVGQYTSLALVDGHPAISYYDTTNQDLKFVRANDAAGTVWGTPVRAAATTGNVGQYTSLAVVDGYPAISYYDVTNQDLKFVRARNAAGTSWGAAVSVDTTGSVGTYTSLGIVDGFPAISYYDATNADLKFVRASDATGTTWGTPVKVATSGSQGTHTSLAIVNGLPAISYHDVTNQDLKFVRASNASGTAWGTAVSVDTTGSVGTYTSLAIVNGFPAISYYDATNQDLKFVRANNANATSWGTRVSVTTTGSVGQYLSLAIVGGRPSISYYDSTNADLKFVRASNTIGTTWQTPVTVDTAGNVGQYTSLAMVDHRPAIAYYDVTRKNLKFAYGGQEYTVIYHGNGHTGGTAPDDSSSPYADGATVTVLATSGTLGRTGFTFTGWNTAADGSGIDYAATGAETFPIEAEDVTLYAQWSENTYTVTYDGNGNTGGTVPADASSPYTYASTVTVLANTGNLARVGYNFVGWNTASHGAGIDYAATGSATFSIWLSNVVLYAKWVAATYTVTYQGNGNTGGAAPTDPNVYNHGGTATVLPDSGGLTRAGYTFAGWNTAADGSGTDYSGLQSVVINGADVVLYAKWTPVPTIISATYDATTGMLVVTGANLVSVGGSDDDIVATAFRLRGEGAVSYTLTNTANVEITSSASFTLVLSETDRAAVNRLFNKNGTAPTGGAAEYNLAVSDGWTEGGSSNNSHAVTASNVPTPTISGATYNAATGVLVVTGTDLSNYHGPANDIDLSKLTITGDGGATYTLTTDDVELDSSTQFTATLNVTDRAAVNLLLNKNGESSLDATTYNLAAAEDWAAGADPAVSVADTADNPITASSVNSAPVAGFGNALSLEKANSEGVQVADNNTLDWGTGSFTVEAWIKRAGSGTGFYTIAGKQDSSGWYFRFNGNTLNFTTAFSSVSGNSVSAPTEITDTDWHHVAAVHDATAQTIAIFVDGVLSNSVTYTTAADIDNTAALGIGFKPNFGEYFDGAIDDVRIWTTARTASQIREYMRTPLAGNETGLVGYWNFEEGSGTATANRTGTSDLDGTLQNADGDEWIAGDIPYRVTTAEDTAVVMRLGGSDPESQSAATAVITALPANGDLYQTDDGSTAGDLIDSIGTALTDAGGNPRRVIYVPDENFNGSDSFTYKVNDGSADSANTVAVNLTVSGASDAPVLTSVDALSGATEDTAFTISYATLADAADDADADGDTLSFRIEAVSSGTLTKNSVAVTAGATLLSTGEELVWTAATNASGTIEAFTIRAWDGTAASATAVAVHVNVTAVNDDPSVSGLPASLSFTEDTNGSLDLSASSFSDPDSSSITVTLSASAGTMGLAHPGGIEVTLGGNGTGTVTLAGAPAQVNAYLDIASNIFYTPASHANGTPAATLTVTANDGDGSGNVSLGWVALNVSAVDDAPNATNLSQSQSATEGGSAVAIDDIVVTDVDSGDTITATLTLSNAGAGTLSTGTYGSATSTFNTNTGVWTVMGSVADVNAALAAVAFTPSANNDQNFTITTSVRDAANTGPADGTISFTVTAVSDAPTATNLTQSKSATEDGSAVALDVIVVTDADTGDVITATLTLSNAGAGTLSTGTYGSATSTFDAGMWTVIGSVADVNAALAAVAFTPSADNDQNFTITTRIRDTAGTGPADGTISFTVTPVNDAPTATNLTQSKSATEGGSAVAPDVIVVTDADTGDVITATLTLSNAGAGTLSTGTYGSATSTFDAGMWTVIGSVADVNAALAAVAFTPSADNDQDFTITTRIRDMANTGPADGTIFVTVIAVNAAPTITEPGSITVTEDMAAALTGISFSDTDAGSASVTVTFSVPSGALSASSTGDVTVGGTSSALTLTGTIADINAFIAGSNVSFTPAFNATADVTLTIVINDGGNTGAGGEQSVGTTVTLEVTGVNDAPTLTAPGSISVTEDVAAALIGISFSDTDAGSAPVTVTFSVPSGALSASSAGDVTVGGTSSALTLTGTIADLNAFIAASNIAFTPAANATADVTLTIVINDGGNTGIGGEQSVGTTVTLDVTAVNDAPVFTSGTTFSVSENATAGDTVGDVEAHDGDGGANDAGLTYSIVGGTGELLFDINVFTGAVTVNASGVSTLDFEATPNYTLIVRADDGGVSSNTADQSITINITDAAPSVTASQSFSIAENSANATVVGTAVLTGDTDSITWSIQSGNTDGAFAINSSTGQITVATMAALDYEAVTAFTLDLRATDGTTNSDQPVTITVTNENEAPSITSGANTMFAENATGTVYTATGSDPDASSTLTFMVSGLDKELFAIDPSTGAITFASAPDFENPSDAGTDNIYNINVTVSDGTLSSTPQAVTITVTNVNETPSITSDAAVNVAENQSVAYTVVGSDPDASTTLAYAIAGGEDAAFFTIDPASGVVSFVVAPDFELPDDTDENNVYRITVTASDGTLTSSPQVVDITVTDAADAPVVTSGASVSVEENQTTAYTVIATDQDGGSTLTYGISGGADAAKFTIDPSTGIVTFNTAPNFEAPTDADENNVYIITVTASDGALTSSDHTVAITVTNVNETPSVTSDATANAAENQTAAYTVTGSDPDADTTLTFTISGGADASRFSIDPSTGEAIFNIAPNFESPDDADADGIYEIEVTASDGTLTSTPLAVEITVTDAPETPSVTSAASVNAAENQTVAYTVTGSDADANTTFVYAISGGVDAALFAINPSTGAVTFNTAPNFEAPADAGADNVYNIIVTASDGALTSSPHPVAITVMNVNEAPAVTSGAAATFAENASGTVYTAAGTDPDASTTLTFALGGTDAVLFSIDANTGVVTFISSPNFETPADANADNAYDITVTASDGSLTSAAHALAITVTDANDAPTNLALSANALNQSQSANAEIGTLRTTDEDADETFTYTLVSGLGSDDNASFNISGDKLRANDPSSLTPSNFSVRVRTTDSTEATFEKVFSIVVTDDVGPAVASISGPADGLYGLGQTLEFSITFTEAVTVTTTNGTPVLNLTIGGVAREAFYAEGSGTTTLVFRYVVQAGDSTDGGELTVVSLSLEGGTIKDANGNNASLTFTAAALSDVVVEAAFHSADSDQNWRLSLLELTRVIELYNTRDGTTRTGAYHTDVTTEDGFAAGTGAITSHHSADTNQDGKLSLLELTRVIELYNTREETTRTGEYHRTELETEDGFAPGARTRR